MHRLLPELLNAALIALGILSAGMGLKGFLLSSNFIDGGVTGICMLLAKTTGVSLSALLPLVNLPFIAVGYHQMGPRLRRAERAGDRRARRLNCAPSLS